MDRQILYISSFPKSGSTWLTRLLADVLNSPSGGCMPSEDDKEVATEGQDRPGPYIVRKGHFILIDNDTGPVVPSPHRLAWKQLTDEKIVFLVRDPRDICVSGAYHWRQPVEAFLERMIAGKVARCGRWDEYCNHHYEFIYREGKGKGQFTWIRYEDLLSDPWFYLSFFCSIIGISLPADMDGAIYRQSFSTRKAQIGNDQKELRRYNMRKGVVGDWKSHFTPQMNARIWDEFGWMMERLDYE